jgi:crotonobetainyl-CoA:carnitine CoA-transferase CaiB-like acyl-CoA transferase
MALTLPLEGVRIVDLTQQPMGAFCTRVLADYGAEVIKIEPPGGDPGRALPPFVADQPGLERSGTFLFLNTNKRSIVLDLEHEAARERVLDLVAGADAVVESSAPGTLEALGLGYDRLTEANPRIVLTSITNFGQDGPYRDWQGTDLTVYAMGGPMLTTGDVDHEPVRVAGRWAGYQVGYMAALATVVGLHAAAARGAGEHLDVSAFEVLTDSIDARLTQLQAYQYSGRLAPRGALTSGVGMGTYPCADGFVFLSAGLPARIPALFRMLGVEHLLERPEWTAPGMTSNPERIDEFATYILPWTLARTKREIREALQEHGVLGAPISTIAELLDDPHFIERGFFREVDHPETGRVRYPGYHLTLHSEDGPMPERRRAPLLGEHTDAVLGALPERRASVPHVEDRLGGRLPLEGLRILDFTVVWAGPYATMLLADWGAEVIRVESRQHFAPNTRGFQAQTTRDTVAGQPTLASWYPDTDPGQQPWNRAALFNGHARGKRSMTLDLTRPEGQEQFERLVATADGLVENNVPDNIEKLGITWERLSQINPRLVLVRVPAFGLTGPYRGYRTLGNHMESIVGHPVIRAYPGLGLDYAPTGVPADAASGIAGALAFALGVRYRERTGRGLQVEAATAENMVPFLGEFVMDYTLNGRAWEHMGNDHWWLAPHGAYPCLGENRWIAIACRSDEEWRALCGVMLRPELAEEERFASMEARHANRRALDGEIGAWTAEIDATWLMGRLQREGIPAGVVMNEHDLLHDEQHLARGFFQSIDSPSTGRQRHPKRAWRAGRTPFRPTRHAPLLGEDNAYVYRELLGFSEEQYRRFEELGHIGTDYDPSVP